MKQILIVTMLDGSKYAVPTDLIARHRAAHFKDEFEGSEGRSLYEDTIPLFESNPEQILDWASNNMNWEDVKMHAQHIIPTPEVDFQEGWVNGRKELR